MKREITAAGEACGYGTGLENLILNKLLLTKN
jgi:hypothetical protein